MTRLDSGHYGKQANGRTSDHINIPGGEGEDVYAVADGVVEETGFDSQYGNYIVIALSDTCKVKYGHLSEITVTRGQEVKREMVIGSLGSAGMASGPDLSLALYENGEAVNPLKEE